MAKKKVFNIGNALSSGLEETISAAHNYSSELRVDIIPIKKIEVDPENPRDFLININDLYEGISPSDSNFSRKIQEKESLETLAHSIKEQGILNPIIVYKHAEKYRLIAGERRTLASIIAGFNDIQAKILDVKPSALKISILQWIENVERSDLTLWEKLRNLEKIISVYAHSKGTTFDQVTITELSNLIGCAKSHAINYKAVLISDQEIKNLIHENKIRNLEKAALLSNIKSLDIRKNAIDACLNGAQLKKLKMIAELGLGKNPSGKIKSVERRGRQSRTVNFGVTKNVNVARLIVDSVLNNNSLSHISDYFKDINWNDYKSITDTFKQLVKKLEELHAK
jgi:ParB family chromosome partitioning protein